MWFTKQTSGFRGWFAVARVNGTLVTGLGASAFVITVVEPADGSFSNPTVTESVQLPGLYRFDISTIYLIAQGNGIYGVTVQVNGGGVRDVFTAPMKVSLEDIDSLRDNIPPAVFEEFLIDHQNPGTYGAELATKADLAASASTTYLSADSGTIVDGDPDGGVWTNTFVRDNIYWIIGEDVTNGLTVEFVFELPDVDCRPGVFTLFGRYVGVPSTTHYMELWAWNYEASAWEQLVENCVPGGNTSDASYSHEYFERHIDRDNNNEVKVRLVHNISTYIATHALYLDYVALSCIEVVTAVQIAAAVWAQIADGNILGLTAEETIDLTRKILNNRLELEEGSTTNWILYDDDDVVTLLTYDVTDKDGNAIVIPSQAPARRTRGQ